MAARRALHVLTRSPHRAASTAAATVAIGAVACGVCCVLPFALPAVVLASTGGLLAFFAQAFWWALYLAAVLVAGAWLWVGVDTHRSGRRPARKTLVMMAVATVALAAASVWPMVERRVIAALEGLAR